jgi:hypothetical protein
MWDVRRNEQHVFDTNSGWVGRHSSEMQPPPGVAKSNMVRGLKKSINGRGVVLARPSPLQNAYCSTGTASFGSGSTLAETSFSTSLITVH